jgi:tetratricopeptide (TPR) repeat protein
MKIILFFLLISFFPVFSLSVEDWEKDRAYKRWFYNGVWLFDKKQYEKAEGSFRKSLEFAINAQQKSASKDYIKRIYTIREKAFDYSGIRIERQPILFQKESTAEVETFGQPIISICSQAKKFYNIGIKYLQVKDYYYAQKYFTYAVQKNPEFGMAHIELAKIYMFKHKNIVQAENILRDGISSKPKFAPLYLYLGWIYYYYKNDLDSAEMMLRKCYKYGFKNEFGGVAHAMIFQIQRQRIIAELKKEQNIDDETFLAINTVTRNKIDDLERAAVYIIENIEEVSPQWWFIPYISGILYKNTRNMALVSTKMRRSSEIAPEHYKFVVTDTLDEIKKSGAMLVYDPNSAEGHVAKGKYLLEHGEIEKAEQEFKTAIGIKMDLADAHNYFGKTLSLKGDSSQAIYEFKLAIRHKQDYADAYYNLGNEYYNSKSLFEASQNLEKAISYDPSFGNAYLLLGQVYEEKQEIEKAEEMLQKATRYIPNNPKVYLHLGNIYATKEKFDAALEQYTVSVNLKKNYAEVFTNMGIVHFRKWQLNKERKYLDQAIEDLQKARQIKPDDTTIKEYLEYFQSMM